MIREITDPFVESKDEFIKWLEGQNYPTYADLLKQALAIVNPDSEHGKPDPNRVHMIDDGDYQGTLVFVVGAIGYQPYRYWYTTVFYGSCSGCDALEDAWGYSKDHNYEGTYLIALHMLQRMKEIVVE